MLIDSHCHLPDSIDASETMLDAAKAEGVTHVITIGTSVAENQKSIKLAHHFNNVFCTVAIYPHDEKASTVLELEKSLRTLLDTQDPKIVAIGECGIDAIDSPESRSLEDQIAVFEMQVKLAVEYGLPVVIHNRNGDTEVLKILTKYKSQNLKGVIHCFASTWEFAQKVLELGFYLSFSGMITYPSRNALREVVKNAPLQRILVETDAPLLPLQGFRGKPNEPKYVKMVAQKVAEVRGELLDTVAHTTFSNTSDLFGLHL